VEYGWRVPTGWSGMRVQPSGTGKSSCPGSEEEFITEHYWGYTRQRDGSTVEYRVTHPAWRVWSVDAAEVSGDLAVLYGPELARILAGPPASAFLADGSPVTVHAPARIAPNYVNSKTAPL